MSAFAREIIGGTARYYDGGVIAGRLRAAYDLLWVTRDPEEWYFLGTKLLDPAFAAALDPEDLPLAASNFIQDAAECLHVPAMLHLAHLYETGTGGVDRFPCRGYAWYKAAGRLGAKIDEHLARFDLQAARCGWEYISEDIEEILS